MINHKHEVMYGYSARLHGDMRKKEAREAFLKHLHIDPKQLVLAQQVHGNDVAVVTEKDAKKEIAYVDGLVTRSAVVALGMRTADCVPLLFYDVKHHVIGAAHAGWKGTLANIAGRVIDVMKTLGAAPEDTFVSVGPHIGVCCYTVPEERVRMFQKKFGTNSNVITGEKVDIGLANMTNLIASGVARKHITMSSKCTSCCVNEFFSYRKDRKQTFGEMMGIIFFHTL